MNAKLAKRLRKAAKRWSKVSGLGAAELYRDLKKEHKQHEASKRQGKG